LVSVAVVMLDLVMLAETTVDLVSSEVFFSEAEAGGLHYASLTTGRHINIGR
jgi:hypothetical protein